jgi:outer membrane lipoprotein SlyB
MEARRISQPQIVVTPTHPLLLLAAVAMTLFSLAGIAALAGWLPGPRAQNPSPPQLAASPVPVQLQPRQTIAMQKPAPKPAAEREVKAPVSSGRDDPASAANNPPPAKLPAPTYGAVSPSPTFSAPSPEAGYRVAAMQPSICSECGVVETVREVAVEPKVGVGGAIAGGLVGGLIANQIGKGSARGIATVLGAVGGAYAGSYVENSIRKTSRYEVVVRFDDDSTRTFSSDTQPAWRSGDRVRLQNGLLTMGGGRSNGSPVTI